MTEHEYRKECIKARMVPYLNKKIAIYGTGINAKILLNELEKFNIVALLDKEHEGEYYYNKKVISLKEVAILGVDVIIIAAKAESSCVVSERIINFCLENNIKLLNIYGLDEIQIQRNILEQELRYVHCTADMLRDEIRKHETICIQMQDVLCAYRYPEWDEFDLSMVLPKTDIIEIVNEAIQWNKKVYILSDWQLKEEDARILLKNIGVILQTDKNSPQIICNMNFAITIRNIAIGFEHNKILYVGTNYKYKLAISQMYGMDVFLIKSAQDIFYQFSTLSKMGKIIIEGQNKNNIYELIQYSYRLAFLNEYENHVNAERLVLPLELNEKEMIWENYKPILYPYSKYVQVKDLQVIQFPQYDKPDVSIVIPVYNQFLYTYNCLRSVFEHSRDISYEIIVADDCSSDDTLRLESVVTGIKIIRNEENLLFVRNCNNAAKMAKGRYVLFLNNDTQVQPGWLNALLDLMEADKNVGLVGSQLIYPDGSLQEAGGIVWENGCACNFGRGRSSGTPECNYVREVDYISGASIMIRTELWKDIGGFDERYIPAYCEDSDLAFEVRRRGLKVIYQPESKVVHFEGKSNGTDVTKGIKAYQVLNSEKFKDKWKAVLEEEAHEYKSTDIIVRDRKGFRRVILLVGLSLAWQGKDISEKTILRLKNLIAKDYIVKMIPINNEVSEIVVKEIQQIGVEVLYGDNIVKWIFENQKDIDEVCIIGKEGKEKMGGIFSCTSIDTVFVENFDDFLMKDN